MKYFFLLCLAFSLVACQTSSSSSEAEVNKDSLVSDSTSQTSLQTETTTPTLPATPTLTASVNDSLNEVAAIIAGMQQNTQRFKATLSSSAYQQFSKTFTERWQNFDTTRVMKLKMFCDTELNALLPKQATLFYPFSGPDILYANCFFPNAQRYVMVGLEPVGSLPDFSSADSLGGYFDKLNTSLNAILKFSFFRTVSMSSDLKNKQVDGTLHVLLLFLKRNGNAIANIKPLTLDSTGQVVYLESLKALKTGNYKSKGVEITFLTPDSEAKTVTYFSLNAADDGLKNNTGFVLYLKKLNTLTTYLKGASYLMHKSNFSIIRSQILTQSAAIVQDDSGIALRYFSDSGASWTYHLFGKYTRPIPMFSACYQSDLDRLYTQKGSKNIGFGIGYNFRDKNSNFMIAIKN